MLSLTWLISNMTHMCELLLQDAVLYISHIWTSHKGYKIASAFSQWVIWVGTRVGRAMWFCQFELLNVAKTCFLWLTGRDVVIDEVSVPSEYCSGALLCMRVAWQNNQPTEHCFFLSRIWALIQIFQGTRLLKITVLPHLKPNILYKSTVPK